MHDNTLYVTVQNTGEPQRALGSSAPLKETWAPHKASFEKFKGALKHHNFRFWNTYGGSIRACACTNTKKTWCSQVERTCKQYIYCLTCCAFLLLYLLSCKYRLLSTKVGKCTTSTIVLFVLKSGVVDWNVLGASQRTDCNWWCFLVWSSLVDAKATR